MHITNNVRDVICVYFAQYYLRNRIENLFQAYLQQACPIHIEIMESHRKAWIDDFIDHDLNEYMARQKGKNVKRVHS